MYTEYFKLRENPFAITPDPAYLYLSAVHQEAMGHLLYGTGAESGFVLLTGEVGTGKTTLVRALLEQDMQDVDVALVLNPRLTVNEFLATVCDELHISYPDGAGNKQLVDLMNAHLLKTHGAGRHTVLIIDEAQNLSHDVLEQVRLLTNLETAREKLLRIMLVGQPELKEMLGQKTLRQLSQRITARFHLEPLSRKEVSAYLAHRLSVAGGRSSLFTAAAVRAVYRASRGIPRLINIVCDRALLGAYAEDVEKVSPKIVRKAALEALGNTHGAGVSGIQPKYALAGAAAMVMIFAVIYLGAPETTPTATPATIAETAVTDVAQPVAQEVPKPVPVAQRLFGAQPSDRLMDRLVARWNTSTPPAGVSPCAWLADNVSLHCYQGRDDYEIWRGFDRPSILRLKLPDGSLRHILVTGADENGVEVSTSAGPLRLERDWLEQHWTGDFLLLWEPPLGLTQIGGGATGSAREWLDLRLERVGFGSVAAFQKDRGLEPDGIAGVRTLLTLVAQTDSSGPNLSKAAAGDG